MTNPRRLAVIVLGMHRNGTSAVAGTAVRLGLTQPRTMLPASTDNPGGFYESIQIVGFDQWLLHGMGCDWHDCLEFDTNRLTGPIRSAAFAMGLDILRQEFADARAFLIKDPRLCLTLPVWLPVLRAAGVAVAVLLVIRHPVEAVRSLVRRDRLPEAATASLWLHYMLEAERATRSLPRAVIGYDDLLRDWRGCMTRAGLAAGIAWPRQPDPGLTDIDAFLNRSFRHHVAAPGSAAIGSTSVRGLIDLTWSALRRLSEDPAAPFALEWLDQARRTFASRRAIAGSEPSLWAGDQRQAVAGD